MFENVREVFWKVQAGMLAVTYETAQTLKTNLKDGTTYYVRYVLFDGSGLGGNAWIFVWNDSKIGVLSALGSQPGNLGKSEQQKRTPA